MTDLMNNRMDLFAKAAKFYSNRPAYPDEAIQWIADELQLDGKGRLLDVGCGTGHVCFRFAGWFSQIVGIDPSEPMLIEARTISSSYGSTGKFSFRNLCAEELPGGLGEFRLVSFGASFHRVQQHQVLETIYDMIQPGGGLALLFPGTPWDGDESWKQILRQTVQDWTGLVLGGPFVPSQEAVRNSRFGDFLESDFFVEHTYSLDELVGYMRSTSFASSDALSDRTEAFYNDLRMRLLRDHPDHVFSDFMKTTVVIAVRKNQPADLAIGD